MAKKQRVAMERACFQCGCPFTSMSKTEVLCPECKRKARRRGRRRW